jgi:pimeloyl-ACP methyl ester carboxylesterase
VKSPVSTLKTLALLCGACVMAVSCVRESSRLSDDVLDIGSHRLRIHLEGVGAPTVVVDGGIADQLKKLETVQKPLAKITQVVTYERAGYGDSDPGPLPRDSGREARELKALLEKASVAGPYVLVGHSLGALNMQVFASLFPDQVAGIVLLDPPPISFLLGQDFEDLQVMARKMTAEWESIADSAAESSDPRARAKSAFYRMIASEHREMFGQSARLAHAVSTFGETPLLVIAAGRPNLQFGDVAERFQKFWIEQSRALTQKSSGGTFILATEASHDLFSDAPKLVAESVVSVVREVRAKEARIHGAAGDQQKPDGLIERNP